MKLHSFRRIWLTAILSFLVTGVASAQVESITRGGLGNNPTWNWPAGTWEVAGLLLDGGGQPVGGLSLGYSYTHSGTTYPAFVTVDMLATAPDASHWIRVYRVQGTLAPGSVGADYADYSCDAGGGLIADFCDANTSASSINGNGQLRETDFIGTGTVPGGGVGVAVITRGGLGNSPAWNWPAGTWDVVAVLLDGSGQPIGGLSLGYTYTHSGTTYPAFVTVDMLASALSSNHTIRVLRKQGPITGPTDPDAEVADFPCDDGGGGLAAICDADSASSLIDGTGVGRLRDPDFSPMGTIPLVPSLDGFGIGLLAAVLLGAGTLAPAGHTAMRRRLSRPH